MNERNRMKRLYKNLFSNKVTLHNSLNAKTKKYQKY